MMATRQKYDVSHRQDGSWQVRQQGAERASGVFERKVDAVERGRQLARSQHGQLFIRGLDTFPIVRRKEEAAHGEYRTKRVVLEIYDDMAEAERTGVPYQTRLDPPLADPRVAYPWETRKVLDGTPGHGR